MEKEMSPKSQSLAIAYAIKKRNRNRPNPLGRSKAEMKPIDPQGEGEPMLADGGMVHNPKLEQSKMAHGGMAHPMMRMASKEFAKHLVRKMCAGGMYAEGGRVADEDEVHDEMLEAEDLERPLDGMAHVDDGDEEFMNYPSLTDNEMGEPDSEDDMKNLKKGILSKILSRRS